MKIAHIVCVFPPYTGGIGTACYQQVKELACLRRQAQQGHEVTVFTPKYGKKRVGLDIEGVKVKEIKPLIKFGKAGVLFSLLWKLRGFDIVQLHYPFIGTEKIIWWWKKLMRPKAKLVLYYHMDLVGNGFKGLIFKLVSKYITPRMLKIADKILVSSFDYAKHSDIKNFFSENSNKFAELPFGVDLEEFQPHKEGDTSRCRLRKNYGFEPDDRIVLFVGGLDKAHYFKGLPVLFEALSLIGEEKVKLLVVGKGDLLPFYKDKAKELGVSQDVVFAGYVPDECLPDHYNLADIFVLPSIDKSEAFGIVLIEAQACAKPVIASDLPGVRTVVEDNRTGLLVEPKNPSDLAKKLIYLLDNENIQREFGQNARRRVEEKYDVRKIGEWLEGIYEDL